MNIETLNNCSQALFLIMLIFGLMAAVLIILRLINKRKTDEAK